MDGGGQQAAGPQDDTGSQTVQNITPEFLATGFDTITSIIESYGWLLLISFFALIYLYQKYKPSYEKWKQEQEELREDEVRKKDPDRSYAVQLSMEQSRVRLQERASVDAEEKRRREEEITERKRLEKIEEWEKHKQGKGYHSKQKIKQTEDSSGTNNQLKSKRTNNFRPSYNPLSGDGGGGGSSGYRPSRSNNSGGGG